MPRACLGVLNVFGVLACSRIVAHTSSFPYALSVVIQGRTRLNSLLYVHYARAQPVSYNYTNFLRPYWSFEGPTTNYDAQHLQSVQSEAADLPNSPWIWAYCIPRRDDQIEGT